MSEDTSFSRKWTKALLSFTKPLLQPFLGLSHTAAVNPKLTMIFTIVFSLGIMMIGLATNFTEETSDSVWTPQGSKPVSHGEWLDKESNFPTDMRTAVIVVHRDGKSLFEDDLALTSTQRLMEALEEMRQTPRYDELCQMTAYRHPVTGVNTCQVVSATEFWSSSVDTFQAEATSSEVVLQAMSKDRFPSGGPVDFDQIIGYNAFDESTGVLNNGQSFVTVVMLPPDAEDDEENYPDSFAEDFEEVALERMHKLREVWSANSDYKVEIIMDRSFEDEFARAVTQDLPLLPLVFVIMSVLCIALFTRRDSVLSRSWMGFGAVVTVLLAIIASFGLLFAIGVPFTSLTPLLPFIMFGVGLDDAFIISGAYARTDSSKTPVERIDDTMEDIGGTILLTTLTSGLAFALGAVSSIPAVRFLVIYAFPTIIIDYLFQITFFVAIIVIDQRRIEENRRDCCFCCSGPALEDDGAKGDDENAAAGGNHKRDESHYADQLMSRYADFLLQPTVKYAVVGIFALLLAFMSWRTSELTQYFDFTTVIPSDSYIQTWWDSFQDYYEANGVRAGVYFRNINFADPDVQDQMNAYVQELADMPYAGDNEPFSWWLRDFQEFIQQPYGDDGSTTMAEALEFEEQIQLFLQDPVHYDAHNEDIVLNDQGVMTASRTLIRLDYVDDLDVLEVVDALELQRSITANQPINQGRDDWAFFTFSEDYYIWEFYRVSPDELRLTTIIGVISVSFLALIFIPHWSALFFVGPMVAVLYIDLLGFIQICGVHVNPVMYISTVMSIGLMVDFVMHVTVRYIETKNESSRTLKTKDTLSTIGASVLVGGFSTLIGVLPLALSTSEIFWTTFIIFFGLVFLGLLHGLVLLPVLLSMCGPLESVMSILHSSSGGDDGPGDLQLEEK